MNLKTSLALYKKTALSFGGLFTALECFFAVFIYAYIRLLVPNYAAALITGLTVAVSVALMPAVHSMVNRVRSVVMGRYHGAVILSTLLCALTTCLLFSVSPAASMPYKAVMLTVNLLLLCLGVQTFSYAVFSITVRVTDHGDRFVPLAKGIVSGLAAAAVAVLMFCYFDYSAAGIERMAYIVGIFILAAGCCVYFSTYTVIPKLIKTEPRAFRFAADYKRFFRPARPAALAYAGRYLTSSALLTVSLGAVVVVGELWKLPSLSFCTAVASAAGAGIVLRFLFRAPAEPSRYAAFSLTGVCLLLAGFAAAVILPLTVSLTGTYAYLALCGASVFCGAGYALLSVAYSGYMEHTYGISGVTRGTHKCIKGMLTTSAAATAVIMLSAAEAINGKAASDIFLASAIAAVVAAFAVAGVILSMKGEKLGNVSKNGR